MVDPLAPLVHALARGAPPSDAWERTWGAYRAPLVEAWQQARDLEAMRRILRWAGLDPRGDIADRFALRAQIPTPPDLRDVIAGAQRHAQAPAAPFVPHPRTFESLAASRRRTLRLDELDTTVLAVRTVEREGIAERTLHLPRAPGRVPSAEHDGATAAFECRGFADFVDTVRDTCEADPERRAQYMFAFGVPTARKRKA